MKNDKTIFLTTLIMFFLLLCRNTPANQIDTILSAWLHNMNQDLTLQNQQHIEPQKSSVKSCYDNCKINASIRTFWIDKQLADQQTSALAIGGFLGFRTRQFHGLDARFKLVTSQHPYGLNSDNIDNIDMELFDGTQSFTYLSEAQLDYHTQTLDLRVGRISIESPFADPDDIRMAPNTFEGSALDYTLDNSFLLRSFYLIRWAGFGSTDETGNQSNFKRFADNSSGIWALGTEYTPDETCNTELWYYYVNRLYDLFYVQTYGKFTYSDQDYIEWGMQAAHIREQDYSGIAGNVMGVMGIIHFQNVYIGGAFNYALVEQGHVITDGFGGGPYYTSLDEATLGSASEMLPGKNITVYRLGGGMDIARWIPFIKKGLHVETMHGAFNPKGSPAFVQESDLLFWLSIGKSLRLDAIFAHFDIKNSPDPQTKDFKHYWIRIEYTF